MDTIDGFLIVTIAGFLIVAICWVVGVEKKTSSPSSSACCLSVKYARPDNNTSMPTSPKTTPAAVVAPDAPDDDDELLSDAMFDDPWATSSSDTVVENVEAGIDTGNGVELGTLLVVLSSESSPDPDPEPSSSLVERCPRWTAPDSPKRWSRWPSGLDSTKACAAPSNPMIASKSTEVLCLVVLPTHTPALLRQPTAEPTRCWRIFAIMQGSVARRLGSTAEGANEI